MNHKRCLFLFICISATARGVPPAQKPIIRQDSDRNFDDGGPEEDIDLQNKVRNQDKEESESDFERNKCWMKIDTQQHFSVMDKLDAQYENIRRLYQDSANEENFDGQMLNAILKARGVADREMNKGKYTFTTIPSGLNLGGNMMFRMRASVLFFHRLKLRNATQFRINYLHHDLMSMTLVARLSLHDLHLQGSFERALSDRNPSILFYAPSYGGVEFLLSDVNFKAEGRYRLLNDRLTIEMIVSDLSVKDILMTFPTNNAIPESGLRLYRNNIAEFADKMKIDLNKWLKDYFNDYLINFSLEGDNLKELQKYDKKKELALNEFADYTIDKLKNKLLAINGTAVTIPTFQIHSVNGMTISLQSGVIRGLHTMYRRSIATGKQVQHIRKVDAVVAFSQLKVMYKYQITLNNDLPPLDGRLYLTSDELTAHMSLTLANNTDSFDVTFDVLEQTKLESLIVEGSANTLIGNFKHILEQHVIAIMTNALLFNIKLLGTLTKCEPDYNRNFAKKIEEGMTSKDTSSSSDHTNYQNEEAASESNNEVNDPDKSTSNEADEIWKQDLYKIVELEGNSSPEIQEASDTDTRKSQIKPKNNAPGNKNLKRG